MTWQKIETAPRDGTRILGWSAENGMAIYEAGEEPVFGVRGGVSVVLRYEPGWIVPHDGEHYLTGDWRPTHWMPLPAPPGGEE